MFKEHYSYLCLLCKCTYRKAQFIKWKDQQRMVLYCKYMYHTIGHIFTFTIYSDAFTPILALFPQSLFKNVEWCISKWLAQKLHLITRLNLDRMNRNAFQLFLAVYLNDLEYLCTSQEIRYVMCTSTRHSQTIRWFDRDATC